MQPLRSGDQLWEQQSRHVQPLDAVGGAREALTGPTGTGEAAKDQ